MGQRILGCLGWYWTWHCRDHDTREGWFTSSNLSYPHWIFQVWSHASAEGQQWRSRQARIYEVGGESTDTNLTSYSFLTYSTLDIKLIYYTACQNVSEHQSNASCREHRFHHNKLVVRSLQCSVCARSKENCIRCTQKTFFGNWPGIDQGYDAGLGGALADNEWGGECLLGFFFGGGCSFASPLGGRSCPIGGRWPLWGKAASAAIIPGFGLKQATAPEVQLAKVLMPLSSKQTRR